MSSAAVVHRLLLATDGSPPARLATVVAARMAASGHAELTLLHVAAASQYRFARMAVPIPVTRRLDDPLASAVLNDARRLAFGEGATCTPVLLAGDPPAAIVAWARRLDAELLVIGAHEHPWFTVARGRTGRRVQAHAPCPVLAVHDPRAQSRTLGRRTASATPARFAHARPAPTCGCCSTGGCACCGTAPVPAHAA